MKIRIKDRIGNSVSIGGAVDHKLSESDYYAGQTERLQSKAENTAKFVGALVEMLNDSGILTNEQVVELLGGYTYEVAD